MLAYASCSGCHIDFGEGVGCFFWNISCTNVGSLGSTIAGSQRCPVLNKILSPECFMLDDAIAVRCATCFVERIEIRVSGPER